MSEVGAEATEFFVHFNVHIFEIIGFYHGAQVQVFLTNSLTLSSAGAMLMALVANRGRFQVAVGGIDRVKIPSRWRKVARQRPMWS